MSLRGRGMLPTGSVGMGMRSDSFRYVEERGVSLTLGTKVNSFYPLGKRAIAPLARYF
jgi:hypothetical protein